MHVRGALLLACTLLAPWGAIAQPGGPLEAALKFFEAKSCAEAFSL